MKKKTKNFRTIIISPSGNLYGSEQVLLDFLNRTKYRYLVFVPNNSLLSKELQLSYFHKQHKFGFFHKKKIHFLYLNIIRLLLFKKVNSVYVNEGGHIRWINVIAAFFFNKKFIVHIRMIEDASSSRLRGLRKNIHLVSISNYINNETIKSNINTRIIYDPYNFSNSIEKVDIVNNYISKNKFVISIIGRISKTKGFDKFLYFATAFNKNKKSKYFQFNFYGEVTDNNESTYIIIDNLKKLENLNIHFKGFVQKDEIYKNTNAVLHLSVNEGLGRILFESLDHQIPFIGFNAGGIGELANLLGYSKTILPYPKDNKWITALSDIIIEMRFKYPEYRKEVETIKSLIKDKFSVEQYVKSIEQVINSN